MRPDVCDELIGDLRQRHLGDVQLVLGDQCEQQVEGTLEVVQVHLEGVLVDLLGRRRPHRVFLSRHGNGPVCCHSWVKGVTGTDPPMTPLCSCPRALPGRGKARAQSSVSRRTSVLDRPFSSKSASNTATASRTILPRSVLTPCSARRANRACSNANSSGLEM